MTMAVNIGIMLLNQASGQVTPILLIALVNGAAVFTAVASRISPLQRPVHLRVLQTRGRASAPRSKMA